MLICFIFNFTLSVAYTTKLRKIIIHMFDIKLVTYKKYNLIGALIKPYEKLNTHQINNHETLITED